MSICTACGEFYTYRGHLHCPPNSPVTVAPTTCCCADRQGPHPVHSTRQEEAQ